MVEVLALVVMVATAPPAADSVGGLIPQVGKLVGGSWTGAVTVQAKVTGPTKPVFVTTVIFALEVPPGAIASGLKAIAVRVKSTWAAAESANRPIKRKRRKSRAL